MTTVSCPECNKVFSYRKNLYQHQRNIHNIKPTLVDFPKNFTCDVCGISFTFMHNLRRHKKNVHNVRMDIIEKHECSFCDETFRTQHSYLRHLAFAHNEDSKTYTFISKREFEEWKSEEEEKTQSIFSTRSCYKVFKNARRTNFLCHRYGEFKSRNTGRRCLRMQGSTREGNLCTARMEVTEFQNGEVRVIYFPRHKMHKDNVDYKNRKVIVSTSLTSCENRNSIAEKISNNRKGRIRLSDIRYTHKLSQLLDPSLILKTLGTKKPYVFIVRSENDPSITYNVSQTGNLCFPGLPSKKCNLICSSCNVCIHEYKCSCNSWAQYGGLMCKHVHLVATSLQNYSLDHSIDEEGFSNMTQNTAHFDNSIFIEIEVNGINESEENIELPLLDNSNFSLSKDEIDITAFESIMNFGRNAAVSELTPDTIQKINTSAYEFLSLLQSLSLHKM